MMKAPSANAKILAKLMFRLLPIQVLLAAVGAVNGIVSSFFASNYVGIDAMSAVGLYSPITMLLSAFCIMLGGGSAILCGKYMGRNEPEKMHNVFSLNLWVAALVALFFIILFVPLALFDLTGFFTRDRAVRPLFNSYLLGQVIGIFPLMIGNQLPVYLAMENKQKRTMTASLIYIGVNVALNFLFVRVLHMEAFGLALASSLGLWVFFGVQALAFRKDRSIFKLQRQHLHWPESAEIFKVGLPGAASSGYETIRKLVVNYLLQIFVGSVAISAFAASDNLLRIFWAIPVGMQAVMQLMIGVSMGEEDRRSLVDITRVVIWRYAGLMCLFSLAIIVLAVPFTRLFFRDPTEPVYQMTVWAFRILPLCMPLSVIDRVFVCYGQASGKQWLVHILAFLNGVGSVVLFSVLLIRPMGINGVYIANVLNGLVCELVIFLYSWIKRKRCPRNVEQLMVIPDDFGAADDARIDISVQTMDEVVTVSEQVAAFCLRRGIDDRRTFLASLSLEEMAGNIVDHGFTKDKKPHSIDIRVVHKDDDLILRIRDDCVPFDPAKRKSLVDPDDVMKNVGIRMIYKIVRDVEYQSILGLNVLTVRI